MPDQDKRYELSSEGDNHRLSACTMQDACTEAREYLADGDWDTSQGESYLARGRVTEYTTTVDKAGEEDEEKTDSRYVEVEIEVDIAATIKSQVGRDYVDCPGASDGEHEWESTYEREGGCTSNPGVWSRGGTSMSFRSHCLHCALEKDELHRGSQRNPDEGDSVTFSLCEDWDEKYAEISYAWNYCLQNETLALLVCTATKGSLEREAIWEITKDDIVLCEQSPNISDSDHDTDRPFDEDGWPAPPESEVKEARELLGQWIEEPTLSSLDR